jgi:hypothetical protein
MPEFTTDKPVTVSKLAHELGDLSARWVGPDADGVTTCTLVDGAVLTQESWDAAVAAHVADAEWVNPPPPPGQALDRVGSLATMLALAEVLSVVDAAI